MRTGCLAATGSDPTAMLVFGALLLLLGAAGAIIAIRRGRHAMAAIALALVVLGAPLAVGPATSAQAAGSCASSPSSGSTAACTPAARVDDFLLAPSSSWQEFGDPTTLAWFEPAHPAAYQAALVAMGSPSPTSSTLIQTVQNDPTFTQVGAPVDATGLAVVSATGVTMPRSLFQQVGPDRTSNAGGIALIERYDYNDGCGGALTTTITIGAGWSFPP